VIAGQGATTYATIAGIPTFSRKETSYGEGTYKAISYSNAYGTIDIIGVNW
jgi:hypothetical protein